MNLFILCNPRNVPGFLKRFKDAESKTFFYLVWDYFVGHDNVMVLRLIPTLGPFPTEAWNHQIATYHNL